VSNAIAPAHAQTNGRVAARLNATIQCHDDSETQCWVMTKVLKY
jgi:hypothetical protein